MIRLLPATAMRLNLILLMKDGTTQLYTGACMSGFYYDKWERDMPKVKQVTLELEAAYPLTLEMANAYVTWLGTIGFDVDCTKPYVVETDNVNYQQWFSTMVVLRYMWEAPQLVKNWYDGVYHVTAPKEDKWRWFLACHAKHPGHCLIASPLTMREVVDPVRLNTELKQQPTEWFYKNRVNKAGLNVNAVWGSNQYNWNGSSDIEEAYKYLLTLPMK